MTKQSNADQLGHKGGCGVMSTPNWAIITWRSCRSLRRTHAEGKEKKVLIIRLEPFHWYHRSSAVARPCVGEARQRHNAQAHTPRNVDMGVECGVGDGTGFGQDEGKIQRQRFFL